MIMSLVAESGCIKWNPVLHNTFSNFSVCMFDRPFHLKTFTLNRLSSINNRAVIFYKIRNAATLMKILNGKAEPIPKGAMARRKMIAPKQASFTHFPLSNIPSAQLIVRMQ